jgi:hypothetical protein
MDFDTYGPIPFQLGEERHSRWRVEFWDTAKSEEHYGRFHAASNLPSAIGCYAAGLRFRGKTKVWYVGRTIAQGGFEKEIFQEEKVRKYRRAFGDQPGRPVMFLFPLLSESGGLSNSRASGKAVILWLEKTLIAMAVASNPDLSNSKDARFTKGVFVYGLMGKQSRGRPYAERKEVRSAFGLQD